MAWGQAYSLVIPQNPAEDATERLAATIEYKQEYDSIQQELDKLSY